MGTSLKLDTDVLLRNESGLAAAAATSPARAEYWCIWRKCERELLNVKDAGISMSINDLMIQKGWWKAFAPFYIYWSTSVLG